MKSTIIALVFSIFFWNCTSSNHLAFKPKVVYKTNNLIVKQISKNSFIHISYLQTNDFGNVPCNGLIVRDNKEVIIFDTPTNDTSADELVKYVKQNLHCKINAIVPTHFHDDCLGGLKAFHKNNIVSYANRKTIELAQENNLPVPMKSITDSLTLNVGDTSVSVRFFGEGHTKDNVVGYFASENVLFGGCLMKELQASKGYLGDANVSAWSNTVEKIKNTYPNVKIVVPGHGECGDKKLLDYTIKLFQNQ